MTTQIANQFIKGFSALTHADISAYIGRTLTAGEITLVGSLIEQAEIFFCKATNRNFLTTVTYQETLNGGQAVYPFSNFPVQEINTITLDGVNKYTKGGSSNTYVLNTDFFVFEDHLEFVTLPNSISDNRNALVITYTIYNVFGADAKFALLMWVANYFLNRESGGKDTSSINASGISESFTTNVPDYIKAIINSYRKNNV